MQNDIVSKLGAHLQKTSFEEADVVYILSRVRKLLEINGNSGKYGKLKFYCDWALHAEIERGTKVFQKELEDFIAGNKEAGGAILTHQYFEEQFRQFLGEYNIPEGSYVNMPTRLRFRELLAGIYSDTPLIVSLSKRVKITTNAGVFSADKMAAKMEIGYNIVPIE